MKMNFCRVLRTLSMRYQDNRVVVNIERGRQYSFPDYHCITNQIANMIRSTLSLGRDDIALLLLDNDNLSLLHFPAVFKQEATFAFGNVRDSKVEHARQVAQLRPKAAFIETRMLAEYQDLLRQHACAIVVMDRTEGLPTDVHCFWDLVNGASDADNEVELDVHEHVAILRLTGGTTGPGKCAMYSIDQFLALRDSAYIHPDFAFDEDTRYLAFTPLSHAALIPFVQTFFTGGTTYTLNAPELRVWCETVQSERITHSLLVPTLLYRLLDMNSTQLYDLTSLRSVIYGAAPIAPASVERLLAEFGQIFCQLYAATECFMLVSVLNKHDHNTKSEAARKRLSSAGRVTPGVEIMIMGDEDAPLPVGETGEIWLRTRGTISGYRGNLDATASEFSNGFWKSGDLGYLDEHGYLFIVDRKKDMIISGGFNVYAVEVEGALAEHPAVLMAAVIGVPHSDWGEAVHAEVVLREQATASESDLIAYAKTRLASYKAPKSIRIVSELPLSPVGKVLRRQVRAPYWEGRDRQI